MTLYFIQAFIYLCAAVIAVPIAKRLGLGSVLGYLIAGVVIGPVLGLVGQETATIQHYAEFGVAMMLFLVGLELEPRILWEMRHRLLGLGGLQVLLTVLLVTGVGLIVVLTWTIALTIGLIFSLSSTAIVLQTFNEKGLNKTDGARNSFSVLLFQDIAVLPMLALIPLMALPDLVEAAQAAAQAKIFASESAIQITNDALQIYGAAGYSRRNPLERFLRDARMFTIGGGTAQILRTVVASRLLKRKLPQKYMPNILKAIKLSRLYRQYY